MALEAVVFPQDPFAYPCGEYLLCHSLCNLPVDERSSSLSMFGLLDVVDPNPNSSSPETCTDVTVDPHNQLTNGGNQAGAAGGGGGSAGRRKRRRSRSGKNKEEMENQRMTHIAVERNRRKLMNEYLGVLRSLMPPSYSQRGDQASIIGGAINFVKELEQLLQSMESHKITTDRPSQDNNNNNGAASMSTPPFADFFAFPQYSTRSAEHSMGADSGRRAVADIEVTMVESHASIKALAKKRPRQLLKLVAGLQSMSLSILHLNVTTVEDSVLYSASVKVEEGCHLNSADEIAAAVHELLRKIEEEAGFFS